MKLEWTECKKLGTGLLIITIALIIFYLYPFYHEDKTEDLYVVESLQMVTMIGFMLLASIFLIV